MLRLDVNIRKFLSKRNWMSLFRDGCCHIFLCFRDVSLMKTNINPIQKACRKGKMPTLLWENVPTFHGRPPDFLAKLSELAESVDEKYRFPRNPDLFLCRIIIGNICFGMSESRRFFRFPCFGMLVPFV